MGEDIKHIKHYRLDEDVGNFIKVWLSVYVSLCYCYVVAKIVPKGAVRLFAFLPIVCLFLFLPLNLPSVHLGGTTAFFVAWLANFKLLLFAFEKGPLSDPSVISLPRFIAVACLPIKIQKDRSRNTFDSQFITTPFSHSEKKQSGRELDEKVEKIQNDIREQKSVLKIEKGQKPFLNYATKGVLLALFFKVYDYSENIHTTIIMVIYCFHIYFSLELSLAFTAALVIGLFGIELEPQFDAPLLSTSLQDFWGRRWNLMVTRILRPTVYDPVLNLSTKTLGRKWAAFPAIMATFIVSGFMHELMFYYLGRAKPTWEITWFFLLHGFNLVVEVAAKKTLRKSCHVPRMIGTILTVGYVVVTGFWLFFPQLLRCKADVRAFEEYAALGAFVNDLIKALNFTSR